METITTRLKTLYNEIQHLATQCNSQNTPKLVAVSKYHSAESIMEAIKAGQRIFGENKVQEALSKWPEIKSHYPDIQLHMIGPLQTNKVADVFKVFDVIESIDRPKLVKEIAKQQEKTDKVLRYFIQINIGNEPQKAGVTPEDLPSLLTLCGQMKVDISGLMCIPPAKENALPYFKRMHMLADQHQLQDCSMGMSGDYPEAIKAGATLIRLGTAIFGSR